MDVYSCRDFDTSHVERLVRERLGAFDLQITDVSEALVYRYETEKQLSASLS
jgi:hypothetical protein